MKLMQVKFGGNYCILVYLQFHKEEELYSVRCRGSFFLYPMAVTSLWISECSVLPPDWVNSAVIK